MAGTGNLLLKRGTNMPYNTGQDNIADDTDPKVLLKCMPAAQVVGLSPYYTQFADAPQYVGTASVDLPNRLWLGMDGYSTTNPESGGEVNDESFRAVYPTTGNITINQTTSYTRPLWVGAEIRASKAVKEDNNSANGIVILKANWDKPSDYILVTQKAISVMPLRVWETTGDGQFSDTEYLDFSAWNGTTEGSINTNTKLLFPDATGFNSDGVPAFDTYLKLSNVTTVGSGSLAVKKLRLVWGSLAASFNDYVTGSANIALLGEDGAVKGSQTFQSKLVVEQELEVNGYTSEGITYGAKITSQAEDAYLFNENVLDLSIGGGASVISIGNPSSDSCTVTVYDELIVTGNLEANSIDGGNF
jgi:hypothetical protein